MHTFTIGFEERSFDERADARLVAERYGRTTTSCSSGPDAALLLPALAEAFDEPFADSSALPTYLVSQLAAEHVKVALSGEGGDELFGGYYTYAADLLADRVAPLARLARPLVERLPTSTAKASFDYKAKRFVRAAHLPPLERHHGWKEIFSRRRARRADAARAARSTRSTSTARAIAETEGAELLARLQDVDLGIYLVDDLLVKTDRASMAHSLEARVPFLDTRRDELRASRCRREHKVRGLSKKVLLRKAAEPLLPREIVHGRKRGFSIPAAAWLRGELEPFARETLSPETLRRQGFFEPEPVDAAARRARRGRARTWSRQLWGLLAFTLWHERHVEQRAAGAALEPRMEALRRDEGLDRHDGERARARLPAADRDPARRAATRSRSRRATTRRRSSCSSCTGSTATVIGRHGGRSRARQGAADALAPARAATLGARAATSTSRSRTARTS